MYLTKLISRVSLIYITLVSTVFSAGSLQIENAWSPEAPPVAKVMAGYMKINNITNQDLQIQSAKSKLFTRVEIHLTEEKDGMMRMIKQENLNIKAKGHIELKPGGLHMMLIGKSKPIKAGSVIPVTLTLNNGEKTNIDIIVKDEPLEEQHQHHHHH